MARKTKKSLPLPAWTHEEVDLAKKICDYAEKLKGTFLEKFGAAARAFGYKSYASLPVGTKSYISSLGGKRRGKVTQKGAAKKNPVDEWYEDASKTPSMVHALHPEDEKDIINFFERGSS